MTSITTQPTNRAGVEIQERPIALEEWRSGAANGRVREAFACGTAVTVAPIGEVCEPNGSFTIGDGRPGPLTTSLREQLLNLQFGHAADDHGWITTMVAGS